MCVFYLLLLLLLLCFPSLVRFRVFFLQQKKILLIHVNRCIHSCILRQRSCPFRSSNSLHRSPVSLHHIMQMQIWRGRGGRCVGRFYPTTYYSVICFFPSIFPARFFFVVFVSSFTCIKIKGNKVREQRKKKIVG